MWSGRVLNGHYLKLSIGEQTPQTPADTWPVTAELYHSNASVRKESGLFKFGPVLPDRPRELTPGDGQRLGQALFTGTIRDLLFLGYGMVNQGTSPHDHLPVMFR